MKVNKKVLGILTGILLVGSMVGCSNDNAKKETTTPQVENTQTIEISENERFERLSENIREELKRADTENIKSKLGYSDNYKYVCVILEAINTEFTYEEIYNNNLISDENKENYQKLANTLKEKYTKEGFDVDLTVYIDDGNHHRIDSFKAE